MGGAMADFVTALMCSQSHRFSKNSCAADRHKGGLQHHSVFDVPPTRAGRLTRQNRPMSGVLI